MLSGAFIYRALSGQEYRVLKIKYLTPQAVLPLQFVFESIYNTNGFSFAFLSKKVSNNSRHTQDEVISSFGGTMVES